VLTIVVAPVSFAKSKSEKKETLRVLYWNIQNGMWAGQPDKYEKFVDWVKAQDPDICIFAEAAQIYYDGTNTQMPNEDRYLPAHWGELCSRWGHDYHVVTPRRPSTASYNFGFTNYPQAVTSRYPIDSIYIVKGHKPDSVVVNYSGWYQVRVEGVKKPVNIVTVHLKNARYGYNVPIERRQESADNYEGEQHRVKEVTCILDHTVRKTKNPDKELWIMAGDFNSYSGKDNYAYRWTDVDKAFQTHDYMTLKSPFFDLVSECYPDTFMPTCGNLRIDYMYVSKSVLKACTGVISQPDTYTKREHSGVDKFYIPSDHYPIIAEFKISKLK
jgi:endonuclease/exonuclease/phosphatase family metal-dependent hydrolase